MDARETFGALVALAAITALDLKPVGAEGGPGEGYIAPGATGSASGAEAVKAVRRRAKAAQTAPGSTVTLAKDVMSVPSLRQRASLLFDLFTQASLPASAGAVTTAATRAAADSEAGLVAEDEEGDAALPPAEQAARARARGSKRHTAREPGIHYRKVVHLLGTVAVGLSKLTGTAVPSTRELYDVADRAFGLSWDAAAESAAGASGSSPSKVKRGSAHGDEAAPEGACFDPSAPDADAAAAGARGASSDRRASALLALTRRTFAEFISTDVGILGFLSGLRSSVREATQTAQDLKNMFSSSLLFRDGSEGSSTRREALLAAQEAADKEQSLWTQADALYGQAGAAKGGSASLRRFRAQRIAKQLAQEEAVAAGGSSPHGGGFGFSPTPPRAGGSGVHARDTQQRSGSSSVVAAHAAARAGSTSGSASTVVLGSQQVHSLKVAAQLRAHPLDKQAALRAAVGSEYEGDRSLLAAEQRRPFAVRSGKSGKHGHAVRRGVGVGGDLQDALLEMPIQVLGSIGRSWYTHPLQRLTSRDDVAWALQVLAQASLPDPDVVPGTTKSLAQLFQEQAVHLGTTRRLRGLEDQAYRSSFWGSGAGNSQAGSSGGTGSGTTPLTPGTKAQLTQLRTEAGLSGGPASPKAALPLEAENTPLLFRSVPVEAPFRGHSTPLHSLFFTWQASLARVLQSAYLMAPHIPGGHLPRSVPLPPATPLHVLLGGKGGPTIPPGPLVSNEAVPGTLATWPLPHQAWGVTGRGEGPSVSVFGPTPPHDSAHAGPSGLPVLRHAAAGALLVLLHALQHSADRHGASRKEGGGWAAAAASVPALAFASSVTALLSSVAGGGGRSTMQLYRPLFGQQLYCR